MKMKCYLILLSSLLCVFTLTATAQPSTTTNSDMQDQQAQIDALLKQAAANQQQGNNANTATDTTVAAATPAPAAATSNGVPQTGLSDQAFANTVRNMMPLSPDQIKTLHYLFDQSQRAASDAPGIPPKPTSSSMVVNLSPGSTPPVIRLGAGFVTSLVFLDATGQPWPIQAIDWGNPKAFNIEWNKKNNTLLVQALQNYHSGNLAVMLKGLDTPIMITLLPGQDAIDYRVDLRIPRLGPNANSADTTGLPDAGSPDLLNVLDGIPPENAQALVLVGCGGQCRAWLVNKKLYLRTSLTLLSPAWISSMNSSDGTHAYELQPTPVILTSDHGKIVQVNIKGL